MNPKQLSRTLSHALRHDPFQYHLAMDRHFYVGVDELLAALRVSREELDQVVETNDKGRFAFNADRTRLRACQGHTVVIPGSDLQLERVDPKTALYHGTALVKVPAIMRSGLLKMQRHHVHLSADRDTAVAVGRRSGAEVLLEVDARRMVAEGHKFYRSANGVWLVDHVPPTYLTVNG